MTAEVIDVPQPTIPFPSDRLWFDPRVIGVNTEFQTDDFTFVGGDTKLVAPNDPGRIAVGFCPLQGVGGIITVGPWPDPVDYAAGLLSTSAITWFNLFTHLTLVTHEWYANSQVGGQIRVVYVRRSS